MCYLPLHGVEENLAEFPKNFRSDSLLFVGRGKLETKEGIENMRNKDVKPGFLVPGRYELQIELFNASGDGRSNGASWRPSLAKKITLPAGMRFDVQEDGAIAQGHFSLNWWNHTPDLDANSAEARRSKECRQFMADLIGHSKIVAPTPQEEFQERAEGVSAYMVSQAALDLGVAKEDLFNLLERMRSEKIARDDRGES